MYLQRQSGTLGDSSQPPCTTDRCNCEFQNCTFWQWLKWNNLGEGLWDNLVSGMYETRGQVPPDQAAALQAQEAAALQAASGPIYAGGPTGPYATKAAAQAQAQADVTATLALNNALPTLPDLPAFDLSKAGLRNWNTVLWVGVIGLGALLLIPVVKH
jgi:hypothetical protein